MSEQSIGTFSKNNPNRTRNILFVVLGILGVLGIFLGVFFGLDLGGGDNIITGSPTNEPTNAPIDETKTGLFVFTMLDNDPINPKGILLPIVFSKDSSEKEASDWFEPGIIRGIKPIFDNGVFKVDIPTEMYSQIQSISYITNSENNIIVPDLTYLENNNGPYNQIDYLILGNLEKPNGTNIIELFKLNEGPSSTISQFEQINEGETTYEELKTIVIDNLLSNNYCVANETNPPSSEECTRF